MTLTPDPDREKAALRDHSISSKILQHSGLQVLFRTKFQKNDFTREEDFTSLADAVASEQRLPQREGSGSLAARWPIWFEM